MNILTSDQQPIIAQCTPKGSGAIALLRISGQTSVELVDTIAVLPEGKKLIHAQTHTIHYGSIINSSGTIIDHVMFLLMRGPKTFTGQDTVEITCHNNPFIIEAIIELAIAKGARLAQEGEFTRRAVLNNKIDLLQAEAIKELIHANTQMALKKSLAQLKGTFSHWIERIEQELLKTLALSEASFEFIDDEVTFGQEIGEQINNILDEISTIKSTFNKQSHIRNGIRIALIGSVNAGKSSLFNALINYDRAIVTSIPGTTRDSLEAGVYKLGTYITFIDTAGLRQTDDVIEQEGISRSYQEAHKADIILLIVDGSRLLSQEEQQVYKELITTYPHKVIGIRNKADLPTIEEQVTQNYLPVSTTTLHNIPDLEKMVATKIAHLFEQSQSPFLLNQRHYNLLLDVEKKLVTLRSMMTAQLDYELISYELKEALSYLAELTGKTISEKGMDAVFKEFCVGK